jgi:probable HAF family extracellular repeat protein
MTAARSWSTLVSISVILILLPSFTSERPRAATPPGPYILTDLGTFGTPSAHAHDINDAGQVVGSAAATTSGGRPFIWQNGVLTDLGTLGGNTGVAQSINTSGQIAGNSKRADSQVHATLWDHGVITDLTPGMHGTGATGINDAGQVVLNLSYSSAFLWENGALTNLGDLGLGISFVQDINNAGQAVGASYTAEVTPLGNMQHAFLWENGVMRDLGLLPGDEDSGARAINNLGQIVGSSGRTDPDTYESFYRPFLYQNGVMTALPVPSTEAYGGDINESGVVVGSMRAGGGFSNYHAFIHADGVTYNLNSLIPSDSGLHLAWANAIDNAGRIAGVAVDGRGSYHAFLLTPTTADPPPPSVNISIGDASAAEGRNGTRAMNFTVTLSAASSQPLSLTYSTANGTALGGIDYVARAGTLTFNAGETTKTISVNVNGDKQKEVDEYFYVRLTSNSSGTLTDYQGTGTILNDDGR